MKILYIIPYIPFPLQSGGNQAFFNLANETRKEHTISLLLNVRNKEDKKNVQLLKDVWPDVTIYEFEKDYKENVEKKESKTADNEQQIPNRVLKEIRFFEWIRKSMERKVNRRRNKYAPTTTTTTTTRQEKPFDLGLHVRQHSTLFYEVGKFEKEYLEYVYNVCRKGFDLIQTEFFECLPLVHLMPDNVKKVFVHHELRFIRIENEISLFNKVTAADTMLFHEVKDTEIALLRHYDNIIVLTDTDKDILSKELHHADIYVSPALTDAAKQKDAIPFKPARELVFIGSGDHFPNADGVLWFAKEIAPILKEMGCDFKLNVIGKWNEETTDIVRRLSDRVHFTGFVDDLTTFINGKISIIPIRIGSGMRMKIIDSVAASAPIVTTSKGCEGLAFKDMEDYVIADKPEEFAKAVTKVMGDNKLQEKMTVSAGAKLKGIMNADELIKRRMDFYRKLQA